MWICENDEQYCIVPVGADWTNREPLLGFPNALIENDYKKDEYGVLKLIIEANANSDKPYFLILDEMNLSHVERYFADFLSVMESKSKISLHSGSEEWNNVPSEIGFPKNLFIIGTVNIDETTYMFSPKVLDRANVIEFRVTKEEMENYLQSNSVINLDNLEGLGANMAGSFVEIAKDNSLEASDKEALNKSLISFFSELKISGAEFGYRSASEILRFAAVVNKIETTWNMAEIIDAAIMQKLLPKVHGSRRKLEPVLKTLGQLCLQEGQKFDDLIIANSEINFKDAAKIKYPFSLEKILRMYDNLISNGFTSYAEA
jgi:5-methylcytosine-specific restriction protein B